MNPPTPGAAVPIRLPLLLTLGLTAGLTPLAIDLYLPSIPAIATDLGSSVELVQLSVTLYLAVFALAQIVLGPLSDVLGRRATVLGGAGIFLAANLGCILAPDLAWLLGARAVQALGGAAVAVTIPALVRDLFGKDDYARVMGMVMMVMAAAPLLAPTLGSAILVFAHWRWVFVALAVLALTAGLLFAALVPETLPVGRRHSFGLGRILGNYGTLMGHRAGLGYLLTVSFSFAGMIVFVTTSPYVYISLHGVPPQWFGVLFGANILAAMGLSTINTRVIPRLGSDRMLALGMRLQGGAALFMLGLGGLGPPGLGPTALGHRPGRPGLHQRHGAGHGQRHGRIHGPFPAPGRDRLGLRRVPALRIGGPDGVPGQPGPPRQRRTPAHRDGRLRSGGRAVPPVALLPERGQRRSPRPPPGPPSPGARRDGRRHASWPAACP